MASSLGGGDDGDDPDDFVPPRTPKLIKSKSADVLIKKPESEEEVVQETDGIFRNFVHYMYRRDQRTTGTESGQNAAEIIPFNEQPDDSPIVLVARRLALIGDEVDRQHGAEFDYHIDRMKLGDSNSESIYEAFSNIARRVLRDGITWGRIVTVLCFGYRLAVNVLRQGIAGFFSNVVSFIIRFVVSEHVARWIAEQGGWFAALAFDPDTSGWNVLSIATAVTAVCVLAFIIVYRK